MSLIVTCIIGSSGTGPDMMYGIFHSNGFSAIPIHEWVLDSRKVHWCSEKLDIFCDYEWHWENRTERMW